MAPVGFLRGEISIPAPQSRLNEEMPGADLSSHQPTGLAPRLVSLGRQPIWGTAAPPESSLGAGPAWGLESLIHP